METPTGTIVSLADRAGELRAIIEVDAAVACPRCAAGKGCGAGILGAGRGTRRVEAVIDSGLHLGEGDRVQLTLAPDSVLRASIIVYGFPLLGAIVAAAVAYSLSLGDLGAALAALAGIGAGMLFGRRRLRRKQCLREFMPTAVRPG